MKKNYWFLIVLIAFVAGLMLSQLLVQAKEIKTKKVCEYKVESFKEDELDKYYQQKTINELHQEGWKLFEVLPVSLHGTTQKVLMYFKKEI